MSTQKLKQVETSPLVPQNDISYPICENSCTFTYLVALKRSFCLKVVHRAGGE